MHAHTHTHYEHTARRRPAAQSNESTRQILISVMCIALKGPLWCMLSASARHTLTTIKGKNGTNRYSYKTADV